MGGRAIDRDPTDRSNRAAVRPRRRSTAGFVLSDFAFPDLFKQLAARTPRRDEGTTCRHTSTASVFQKEQFSDPRAYELASDSSWYLGAIVGGTRRLLSATLCRIWREDNPVLCRKHTWTKS
jgi:hypothetical protein